MYRDRTGCLHTSTQVLPLGGYDDPKVLPTQRYQDLSLISNNRSWWQLREQRTQDKEKAHVNKQSARGVGDGRLSCLHPGSDFGSSFHYNLFVERVTEHVKLKPWAVQLSAGFSRERVLAAYAVIATRYAALFADKDTTIVSSVFRSRGTEAFYQVRVGTDTFESANDLCAEIRRARGACMVLRNKLNQDNMDDSYASAIHNVTQF